MHRRLASFLYLRNIQTQYLFYQGHRIKSPIATTRFSMSSSSKPCSSTSKKRKRKQQSSDDEQDWFHPFTNNDPIYIKYMTTEWGFEKDTDNELFEKLSLEGAQSGLSWRTILHKREAYRLAFHNFDIDKVSSMTDDDIESLLTSTSDDDDKTKLVVRHRGKLQSVVNNATIIQQLKANGTIASFKEYLWSFVDNKPILNHWESFSDLPSKTEESERMSKALKKHGFKFVGPTTCYSLMQSCGFVIDHLKGSKHWLEAEKRLKKREGGYQIRKP